MPVPDDVERELPEILAECWGLLLSGAGERASPLHTPVLATARPDGGVNARVVVLRAVDPGTRGVRIHTDVRSAKRRELEAHAAAALVGYDPSRGVQLRLRLRTQVHHRDQVARDAWWRSSLSSRRCYLSEAGPGTAAAVPTSGLPAPWRGRNPGRQESEEGFENFAVILGRITEIDWLWLRARGHLRASFSWTETGTLQAAWRHP